MTDLEMLTVCAQAMGLVPSVRQSPFSPNPVLCASAYDDPTVFQPYNPLVLDNQALELIRELRLSVSAASSPNQRKYWVVESEDYSSRAQHENLNRAIVNCVVGLYRTALQS